MDPLLYARSQMGLSLAFHIVFAAAGIGLPALMLIADLLHRRTGHPDWLELSRRLAKGTAILFAVGAVSGTVLSFELGLLWPGFMGKFGETVGLPFAIEGYAFFVEAIFLGIYLYGRDRVSPKLHLFSAFMVALSGAASAFFVTLVNAFMNNPAGFTAEGFDPLVAMWSPSWKTQIPHVLLSCYASIGFAMAGIHAWALLRGARPDFHKRALAIALAMGGVASLLQPIVGDLSAKHLADHQPTKLAALEGHFETKAYAPLRLGGTVDQQAGETRGGVEIPGALSFLAFARPSAEVKGLRDFPRDEWPNVTLTRYSFQVMVASGMVLAGVTVLAAFLAWRRRAVPDGRRFLWLVLLSSPLGLVAMEAGWFVTEFGRQPWIVRGWMRTSEAVTPFPHLAAPFWIFAIVYLFLGVIVILLLRAQVAPTFQPDPKEAADARV